MKKEIFAGLGLGLLIGIIIGLSIAEVTGVILAALTSLLAAFFGLRSGNEGEKGNQVVIGTFGFSCILAILMGIYIRTHNSFSPSTENDIAAYKKIQFSDKEIREIILFKEFGLIPEGLTFSKDAKQNNKASVLMADDQKISELCKLIDDKSSYIEMKSAYINTSLKNQELIEMLEENKIDTSVVKSILLKLTNILCETVK